jgi:hypothetical protein
MARLNPESVFAEFPMRNWSHWTFFVPFLWSDRWQSLVPYQQISYIVWVRLHQQKKMTVMSCPCHNARIVRTPRMPVYSHLTELISDVDTGLRRVDGTIPRSNAQNCTLCEGLRQDAHLYQRHHELHWDKVLWASSYRHVSKSSCVLSRGVLIWTGHELGNHEKIPDCWSESSK